MPIVLKTSTPANGLQLSGGLAPADANCLDVALVNNMPDAALESTERQFQDILQAASHHFRVRLRLFALPNVPRSEAARKYLDSAYCEIAELWDAPPDGIIVTGTEPRAPSLADEPYWPAFKTLVDWAESNGIASVWSCLAAHAAVLHNDGIERCALADKRFGLFDCAKVADHPLAHGVPARLRVAHSRWNELPEEALRARGYTILTRSPDAGVDTFARQRKSLALYFQGHPEYDDRALLREYRRDVGRYLRGERGTYPNMPQGCFDERARRALTAFRARSLADRRADLLAEFPLTAAEAGVILNAGSAAARIYANWLAHLSVQKAQKVSRQARVAAPAARRAAVAASTGGVR